MNNDPLMKLAETIYDSPVIREVREERDQLRARVAELERERDRTASIGELVDSDAETTEAKLQSELAQARLQNQTLREALFRLQNHSFPPTWDDGGSHANAQKLATAALATQNPTT